MAQRAYLLMSAEKFLQGRGNGFSNMDSQCPTGNPSSTGTKKAAALFSPLEQAPSSPLADTYQWPYPPKAKGSVMSSHANGTHGATATKPLTFS